MRLQGSRPIGARVWNGLEASTCGRARVSLPIVRILVGSSSLSSWASRILARFCKSGLGGHSSRGDELGQLQQRDRGRFLKQVTGRQQGHRPSLVTGQWAGRGSGRGEVAEEPWACPSAPARRKDELCTRSASRAECRREQRPPWSQQGGGCGDSWRGGLEGLTRAVGEA